MVAKFQIEIAVNGAQYELLVDPRWTLADVLREQLDFTGTHLGCEHGVCGACTVTLNGEPVRSCLVFAVQADGCVVGTVEGLSQNNELNDLQLQFQRHHALQCGFCTPGFLVLMDAYLRENPSPTEAAVREVVSSNLCRCTDYSEIVSAVVETAKERRCRMTGG